MDLLYIGNDHREIASFHEVVIRMERKIIFDCANGFNEAVQKIFTSAPAVIFVHHQPEIYCHYFLATLKQMNIKQPTYFLLIDGPLSTIQVEEFHSLGVQYFVDRKVFFKKLRPLVEVITRSMCA